MARVRSVAINPGRLLTLRGKRSREDVAHQLRNRGHGTDAKAIWRYETGRSQPNARVLPDYAAVLGVSVDELYTDDEEDSSSMATTAEIEFLEALRPLARLLAKDTQ